jgi:conjugal transfer/entry exclusion protein
MRLISIKASLTMVLMVIPALAFAQATPSGLSTDPQQIENLIQAQGCKYEVSASAQTIASLQKQINELKAQLQKLDPPKSGATKK